MSQLEQLTGYEDVEFSQISISEEDLNNKKIYLFQVPADFNIQKLDGIQLNLKSEEDQELAQKEHESIVISKQDKETQKYMKKQILPLFPVKKSKELLINKKFAGFFKIYKKFTFPNISKKAIRKTKPITMKKENQGDESD
ncbi:hypothetical protein ABPG72_012849 [Tetrahymena utriculariae]